MVPEGGYVRVPGVEVQSETPVLPNSDVETEVASGYLTKTKDTRRGSHPFPQDGVSLDPWFTCTSSHSLRVGEPQVCFGRGHVTKSVQTVCCN